MLLSLCAPAMITRDLAANVNRMWQEVALLWGMGLDIFDFSRYAFAQQLHRFGPHLAANKSAQSAGN
jgi:hypothetical protein